MKHLGCFILFGFTFLGIKTASNEDNIGNIVEISTLGRPVALGELYSAHNDMIIQGFSLWHPDLIKTEKRTIWAPSSKVDFSTDTSNDDKFSLLDVRASLAGSFEAGMVHLSGSANYLNQETDKEDTASVTLSFLSVSRTETLSSTLTNLTREKTSPNCNLKGIKPNSEPTHIVSSITYGANSHFVFERSIKDDEDKRDIGGKLSVTITAAFGSIDGSAEVTFNTRKTNIEENLTVKLYSDFILEKQPRSVNDSVKIYQDISTNFGTKDSLYNQSVPLRMVLIPILTFCPTGSLAEEIGKDILKRATNIRITMLKVLSKIANLLDSRVAIGNFAIRKLLLDFQSDVSNATLSYEKNLQTIIVQTRNPNVPESETLTQLIQKYTSSKYDYAKYLYPYLTEKTRQVNSINIFYTQTILQDEPQIAVYSQADIPQALITEPVVFVLYLYVLPDKTQGAYKHWSNKSDNERERQNKQAWYNQFSNVGDIGLWWRDFRNFFHLNGYKEGLTYFAFFDIERNESIVDVFNIERNESFVDLEIYINGKKEQFELKDLMNLTIQPEVCRTPNKITVTVDNPPTGPLFEGPNKITSILVNYTKTPLDEQNPSPPTLFTVPVDTSSNKTKITIPNLVAEYSYSVTVAYNTEYGSLKPSEVVTTIGEFEMMEETVGCKIFNNKIPLDKTYMLNNTSAHGCAVACLSNTSCTNGWSFNIALGDCYFNQKGSNTTESVGWAIGTKSCGARLPTYKQKFCPNLLFLMPSKIVELPSFETVGSVSPYPIADIKVSVSGLVDGSLLTCGGTYVNNKSEYSLACYSLENGQWVSKKDVPSDISAGASSQYPNGGLIVTSSNDDVITTQIYSAGEWRKGISDGLHGNSKGVLAGHCQVTLGSTVIVTGGDNLKNEAYSLNNGASSWTALPKMNHKRTKHACIILDKTLYVLGGEVAPIKVEKYTLGATEWTDVADLPTAMEIGQAVVFEDKLYAITGEGPVYRMDNNGEVWTPVANVGQFTYQQQFNPAQVLTQ